MAEHQQVLQEIAEQKKEEFLAAKPSRMLALALGDLESCERNPKFAIDMDDWQYTREDGICCVCLGGAVMANRFHHTDWEDWDCDSPEWCIATALNNFRSGFVAAAFHDLKIKLPVGLAAQYNIASYEAGPTQFKADMWALVATLEAAGY